ncbi:MAG: serine hydrolase [Deltaproteobacteria bacterium]|nr:serine hydrolase [Nannocystaceae bacterium]
MGLLSGLTPSTADAADIPSTGSTAPGIEDEIDAHVEGLIEELNLPGVSVAVTRGGKLMLSKSYGYANTSTKLPLKTDMSIRIGSVTKAVVTGPAAFQLMKSKGIDPKTKKLYGAGSVLGSGYAADIDGGIARHLPIIDTAVGPGDKVWTWHANGTVSVGSTKDLDAHTAAAPFTLPPGKTAVDIRGISMAKNGKVWVWYEDGKRSVGTPTDLDAYQKLSETGTKLPGGKSMQHVVGIGIAKSNDRVFAWYEDGTVSSGTPLDFGASSGAKPFTFKVALGGGSYDIRGVDIDSKDQVVAWFTNQTASVGTSTKLHHHLAPFAYTLAKQPANAPMPAWKTWFSQITIQNLLDHRAGFAGSGDLAGTMAMFDEPESKISYDEHHRHFLHTRKLLFKPGTSYAYANHGFGLWTLLIEKISGKPYYPYVRDSYLAPMGLDNQIVPELASPRCADAWNHSLKNDKPVPTAFEQHGLGLAAGGFRASARALVVLMKKLGGKYTNDQLDDMGWAVTNKGKLYHNGLVGGGTAFVAMFPDEYTSNSGVNLGGMHVAVITNMWTDPDALADLADELVLTVGKAGVPASYDGFTGKPTPTTCK